MQLADEGAEGLPRQAGAAAEIEHPLRLLPFSQDCRHHLLQDLRHGILQLFRQVAVEASGIGVEGLFDVVARGSLGGLPGEGRQHVAGRGMVRLHGQQAAQMGDGFVPATQAVIDAGDIVEGVDRLRLQFQDPAETDQGLVVPPLSAADDPEIVEGQRIVGDQFQGPADTPLPLFAPSPLLQDLAQVVQRLGVVRIQSQGLAVAGLGGGGIPFLFVDRAEIEVQQGVIGGLGQGLAAACRRLLQAARLLIERREVAEDTGMPGEQPQHPGIPGLGLPVVSLPVEGHRRGEQFLGAGPRCIFLPLSLHSFRPC